MPRKHFEYLLKIAYAHQGNYCISDAQYRSAQGILALCKERDCSTGEGQQRNGQMLV